MSVIGEFKGQNGKVLVYKDYLVISRKTLGGFMTQGGSSGDRTYFYKDISSVEYKKPNFFSNGYIKVLISGSQDTNAKVGLFGSSKESMKDQNTVILRAFSSSVGIETDKIYALVMKKITESKLPVNTAGSSKMDELKKLGELKVNGIISEEEFKVEKIKLLNK
jgi:hypothetical protein